MIIQAISRYLLDNGIPNNIIVATECEKTDDYGLYIKIGPSTNYFLTQQKSFIFIEQIPNKQIELATHYRDNIKTIKTWDIADPQLLHELTIAIQTA